MSQSNLKCPDKGGPLTVVSRVKTPFIGIITYTPVTNLFSAIYRGPSSLHFKPVDGAHLSQKKNLCFLASHSRYICIYCICTTLASQNKGKNFTNFISVGCGDASRRKEFFILAIYTPEFFHSSPVWKVYFPRGSSLTLCGVYI